jgi:pyruvate/2-oxoglutarate dehydrogenase complex dihydrolipoamide dehydrogenase (E3) component
MKYDIAVLGGGPAGVTAALRAREIGATVALIERDRLGGICTNDGCVPTRVLARTARLVRDAHQFSEYGLLLDTMPKVDFEQVIKRTQQVVYEVHEKKQLLAHLRDVDIDVFTDVGQTHFTDAHHLTAVDGTMIEAEKFVICVGGSANRLNLPGADYALTHSDVWSLRKLPASVAIIGSGATGTQLASIFLAFGSDVTLLDIAPMILPGEDADVGHTMAQELQSHGMQIRTEISGVTGIDKDGDLLNLTYTKDNTEHVLPVETVIFSVGWGGNVERLGLENAGVEVERSYVKVNDYLQTTADNIFAAGDITGKMMLVQSAGIQARTAVENALLGVGREAQHKLVPHGGFTDPEYASVGFTETHAREIIDVLVAVVPYRELDRAVIDGLTAGFCKLIVDRKSKHVIGAHVVGEQAAEVVQMVAAGMAGNLTVDQFADLELAYPTFAAIVGLAARQLVRELGEIEVSAEWRELKDLRATEWERRD